MTFFSRLFSKPPTKDEFAKQMLAGIKRSGERWRVHEFPSDEQLQMMEKVKAQS